jgi:hypothetical protein
MVLITPYCQTFRTFPHVLQFRIGVPSARFFPLLGYFKNAELMRRARVQLKPTPDNRGELAPPMLGASSWVLSFTSDESWCCTFFVWISSNRNIAMLEMAADRIQR